MDGVAVTNSINLKITQLMDAGLRPKADTPTPQNLYMNTAYTAPTISTLARNFESIFTSINQINDTQVRTSALNGLNQFIDNVVVQSGNPSFTNLVDEIQSSLEQQKTPFTTFFETVDTLEQKSLNTAEFIDVFKDIHTEAGQSLYLTTVSDLLNAPASDAEIQHEVQDFIQLAKQRLQEHGNLESG